MPIGSPQKMEHRWHERLAARFPVLLRAGVAQEIQCHTENVSFGGVFVNVDDDQASLKSGNGVQLTFTVHEPDGKSSLYDVTGVVAHRGREGVGIMFAACQPPLLEMFNRLLHGDDLERDMARAQLACTAA